MIKCQQLRLLRGQREIIGDLDLDLAPGQVVAILGENGAGKSTLLNAIAGELSYQGTLTFKHKEIAKWPLPELARQRAVLSQSAQVNFGFNVAELVALGRYPFSETRQQQAHKVGQILDALELDGLAARQITQLSGGEQQRAQFARCLAQLDGLNPKTQDTLMLLDEPTSALDLHHQHSLLGLARQFAQQGNLVIAVLHDLNLASLYADTLLLLHQGRLVKRGSPAQVLNQQTLTPVYRTGMQINLHPGYQVPMIFSEPQ